MGSENSKLINFANVVPILSILIILYEEPQNKLIRIYHIKCLSNSIKHYMCVGPTKGTYRRDIKMIVNHDYIKQCIIFAKIFFS